MRLTRPKSKRGAAYAGAVSSAVMVAAMIVAALSPGCTVGPEAAPATQTSDAALKDPYGNWSSVDTNISGGATNNLDRNGLKRDVDHFWMK